MLVLKAFTKVNTRKHHFLILYIFLEFLELGTSQEANQGNHEDRHNVSNEILQRQMYHLLDIMNELRHQNKILLRRVALLETCECIKTGCLHGNQLYVYQNGETWVGEHNQRCTCQMGEIHCEDCSCNNGGVCSVMNGLLQCDCPVGYLGASCEESVPNPSVYPPDPGSCSESLTRFYFDIEETICKPFVYTGCGGNSNNYVSLSECKQHCIFGSCCIRKMGPQSHKVTCQDLNWSQCHQLSLQENIQKPIQVLSFLPGVDCGPGVCGPDDKCVVAGATYSNGDIFKHGCEQCRCEQDERVHCSCTERSVRKELRDMTLEEVIRFQRAVTRLHETDQDGYSQWEQLRDLYMNHIIPASNEQLFLPWNRGFLSLIERKLQEIDCEVTLPYFQFTTDVADFGRSLLWQANFFGGDGSGENSCVSYHPFGRASNWQPCIKRKFNRTIGLPSMVELASCMSTPDFNAMSQCLRSVTGYLQAFIGGQMMTSAAMYDPVFLVLHTFIDMLYWEWQKKFQIETVSVSEPWINLPMIPLGLSPADVASSESDLCVTYALPGQGRPCNISASDTGLHRYILGDVTPLDFVKQFYQNGYDEDGFDSLGYNLYGFNREGYNREGFYKEDHTYHGASRYDVDTTFAMTCVNHTGFTPQGLDQFGFDSSGYNSHKCNYGFYGPHIHQQAWAMWSHLLSQPSEFLVSVPRWCGPLVEMPDTTFSQLWIGSEKSLISHFTRQDIPPGASDLSWSSRMCFDTEPFLHAVVCGCKPSPCTHNPCSSTQCSAQPKAQCFVDLCHNCQAVWTINGKQVDCKPKQKVITGLCDPNPCANGGTCEASMWPQEPKLTQCHCTAGFQGPTCEEPASQHCVQPVQPGTCSGEERGWFYNPVTGTCEKFVYTGCEGNANNFPMRRHCHNMCELGACCYKRQLNKNTYGYDLEGYDRYGFTLDGASRDGRRRTLENGFRTGSQVYDGMGYDWKGYDPFGRDEDGYDQHDYNLDGFHRSGFNLTGFSRIGEFDGRVEYNADGYDPQGYNRAGFNCYGYNKDLVDYYGRAAGFSYTCMRMTYEECLGLEKDSQGVVQVIGFSSGKSCENTECHEKCGCQLGGKSYRFGETLQSGCNTCRCLPTGVVECKCTQTTRRKEIHDLTLEEWQSFHNAVHRLSSDSRWRELSELYASHVIQWRGKPKFLPWHRYFLRAVEHELQKDNCHVSIPYFDWTMDVGDMNSSLAWQANRFGGNGALETDCVRHHPFKSKYPYHWSPCLRRKFNASVVLPDSIDLAILVREPNYDKFVAQLEYMSSLFHSWVGGHMENEYAAYDPVFLSHHAFVDKVWVDWQKYHQQGLLSYPQDVRYIPMSPFKATPDDVFDSINQMCVEYVPLTQGTSCVMTSLPHVGYDSDGFDRHGFNRQGFDRDGFNKMGVDKNGKPDNRGIYDLNGYDAKGYNREGFDCQDFDRYGFHVSSFNRDGFDGFGFDQYGYDRYGFDVRNMTPYGFSKNGSFVSQIKEADLDIFDKGGYTVYGFGKFGLDRKGYDVFGFDTNGFDHQGCNSYNYGPFYALYKVWLESQIRDMTVDQLKEIPRLCQEVNGSNVLWDQRTRIGHSGHLNHLPSWDWMQRKTTRISGPPGGVSEDNIWLPNTPDERFCVELNRYSSCAFGEHPHLCPDDLCVSEACTTHPGAECKVQGCGGKCQTFWYDSATSIHVNCSGCVSSDGVSHPEGSSWPQEQCNVCTCQNSEISCSRILCDMPRCQNPEPPRGQCCSKCDGCHFKRRTFWNTQQFLHPDNPCRHCVCQNGTVTCKPVPCPVLSCDNPELRSGRCCPTCPLVSQAQTRGCNHVGREYNEGEHFIPEDQPCKMCKCKQGEISCTRKECPAVKCQYPVVEQCCPVCTGCLYQGVTYESLHVFPDPEHPCNECTCVSGTVTCSEKPCPDLTCLHPATPTGKCCPKCRDCLYHDVLYLDKQVFTSPEDTCSDCQCASGNVVCRRRSCAPVTCSHPEEGQCCPLCEGCVIQGMHYIHGQTFVNALDVCEDCECDHGNVTCRPIRCPELVCSHPVQGHCCHECADCMYDGQRIHNGAMVSHLQDKCQMCHCQDGSVRCERKPCPEVNCMKPVQGACCMECPPGCDLSGKPLVEGETVPHPSDPCGQCTCMGGHVNCQHKPCKPATCSHPAFDQCRCPTCDGCLDGRRHLPDGGMFNKDNEPCTMCHCKSGNIECKKVECLLSHPCPHPSYTPGECCPRCKDCDHEGHMVKEGDKIYIQEKPCQICSCQEGEIRCEREPCGVVECRHPFQGPCCPECRRCSYHDKVFQDGEKFKPQPCLECLCQQGTVDCVQIACPELSCPHQTRPDGECCPVCAGCMHKGLSQPEGSTWLMPDDPCVTCTCQQGVTVCTQTECLAPCDRPVPPPMGKCCPVCPGCVYNNISQGVGEPFSPTGDTRDVCICKGGYLECFRKFCPTPVLCPNEVDQITEGKSCGTACQQVANLCSSEQQGMLVRPTEDPCFTCQCKGLHELQCVKKTCPELNCPVSEQRKQPGACCARCDRCHVLSLGLVFSDGEQWMDPDDPCLECQCQAGLWHCSPVQCRPLVCGDGTEAYHNPNQCCPQCVSLKQLSCIYNSKKYSANEEWWVDECTSCRCRAGKVNCTTERCSPIVCPSGQTATVVPDQCCPVCMPAPGSCVGFGDPHYRTYDGRMVHFQGTCRYVMTADCRTGEFRIEVEHDDRGSKGKVSWVKSVTVYLDHLSIDLLSKGRVKVNNAEVLLPYHQGPLVSVERTGSSILLNTKLGVKVQWSGLGYVEVSIPGSYQQKVCGLCGNFNQFPQDDLTTKSGQIVTSAATFGNSWKVEGNTSCSVASDLDPCKKAGYHHKRIANSKCSAIRGPLFHKCYRAVRPDAYFASCVYDLCVCGDVDSCLCDVLSSYALACSQAGITLNWRSSTLCAIDCQEDRGFMFDECGPRCPRTCANRDVPMGEVEARCLKPCVPSCQCPAHLVLHNDRCIRPADCPE